MQFQVFRQTISDTLTRERLLAALTSFFGVLAALLAGIGLYGVLAYQTVRRRGAKHVVLAVPVAPLDTAGWLRPQVDEFVCLATPEPFYAVGNFFEEWPQVTDDEVRALLLAGNTL